MIETIKTNKELRLQTLNVGLALILMVIAKLIETQFKTASIILWGLAFLIGGFFKAVEGLQATLENKALNVEILMLLAALAAFLTRDFQEGAILIFIFAVSGVLETYANTKSEKALTALLELAPQTAIMIIDGVEVEVDVEQLRIDDVVIVKVGQQIPVDGIIVQGATSINEAAITGEFVPVYKAERDGVYAGTLNLDSTILVKIIKDAKDSTMQKIVDFVQEAQASQTQSQTFVDRFEKVYVYGVIIMALLVMFVPYFMKWLPFDQSFYKGVVVLVVGSPCAVVASITPAILSSLSYGANHGILIKGGSHFDQIRFTNTVVFDKTGTITTGKPEVVDFVMSATLDQKWLLHTVVNIERDSNHPLARAIVNHYMDVPPLTLMTNEVSGAGMASDVQGHHIQVGKFDYEDAHGLGEAQQAFLMQGMSLVDVIIDGKLVGFIALQDTVRSDATEVVKALNAMNMETVLLSGDRTNSVETIAKQTHIQAVHAECLPECKVDYIKELKNDGHHVMMLGDGINDAPALALADVGVAMGDATDVSLETADVVFINNKLTNVLSLMKLSKKAHRIIVQNLVFSIGVIAYLLISNLFMDLRLTHGVIAHEGSTILVILNSLRLLRD